MAATTVWPSMALPSRRTPMRTSVHSHGDAPLFRLAVRRVRTGDLLRSELWEQISRTTSTTSPNRLRSGPKLPSQVISEPIWQNGRSRSTYPFPQKHKNNTTQTTFTCSRSIAGVPFHSVRRFWVSLLLRTSKNKATDTKIIK